MKKNGPPVEKKCRSIDWYTPPRVLEPVRELFGGEIGLDPCTTASNPTDAHRFFTKRDDGLRETWWLYQEAMQGVFVNPPYGKAMYAWIWKTVKNAAEGLPIALLLAASSRWDQARWHALFSPECTAMVLFRGRVKYLDRHGRPANSPPYPSILFVYNVEIDRVRACFPLPDCVVGVSGAMVGSPYQENGGAGE